MNLMDIQDVLERAKRAARVGDHDEAERLLKYYIAKNPGDREANLLLGATLAGMGKYDEASDEFNTLLMKDPRDYEALNNIAVMFNRQGKYQQALNSLIEAVDIDPNRAEIHYNIGNIHRQMGNFKAASMAYAKVIELDPAYVPAYNNLGTIYDELKEYNRAFNVFKKGLALDRNNPILHFNYGLALEAKGRLDDAAEQYQASLRSKPGWAAPMNTLGIVYFKQGSHNKALGVFKRLLKGQPSNTEAWNNMGIVQEAQGRDPEAIKSFRRALEINPGYAKAAVNLERILEDSGQWTDAETLLKQLIKQNPENTGYRDRLAGIYLKTGRFHEALEQAQGALELKDDDIQALRVLGVAQQINGKNEEALAAFEKIRSLDPENLGFHLDLADIYFGRKEYQKAEKSLLAYLEEKPRDRNAYLLLGRLYAEMGDKENAIAVFEELSQRDPNDTEALSAAAELHKETGALEKAVQTADSLVNVQGKRASSDDLSELNKSLEFYENAVDAYSSSTREMWSRNMELFQRGKIAPENEEIDFSLFLDSPRAFEEAEEESSPEDETLDLSPGEDFNFLDDDTESAGDFSWESLAGTSREEGEAPPAEPIPAREAGPAAEESPKVEHPPKAPEIPETRYIPAIINIPAIRYVPKPKEPSEDIPGSIEIPDVVEIPVLEDIPPAEAAPPPEEPKAGSGEPPGKPSGAAEILNTLGLLNYLKSRVQYLPEKEKTVFLQSEVRLNLEHLIGHLEGRSGEADEG